MDGRARGQGDENTAATGLMPGGPAYHIASTIGTIMQAPRLGQSPPGMQNVNGTDTGPGATHPSDTHPLPVSRNIPRPLRPFREHDIAQGHRV